MNERRTTDFVVGTYSEAEIKDINFMKMEEQRAHEELKFRGHEYAYTKPDSFVYGEYVRVFRVYKTRQG
ncbi:hypothetical protein HRV88_11100 [Citrobacter portucalensis]|uniref:hypothetical protein n=1 Tax=Citrobacter portucalensis TaxID=1639133 RepID=UPI001F41AA1B|nr:hypothetical protein [Citrobacter portucalensis]UJB75528.1 hypothetical protein HRV88_11100 [Citrobacter portucalensis]